MSSGYRPPSTTPRGAWALHIHAVRRERGWSQTRGFREARNNGLPLGAESRSAYISIDMGKRQPRPEELPALVATYGALPDKEVPAPTEIETGEPSLAGAIRALTDELRAMRQERGRIADLEQTVAGLTARLLAVERATSREREAPPVGAGSGR